MTSQYKSSKCFPEFLVKNGVNGWIEPAVHVTKPEYRLEEVFIDAASSPTKCIVSVSLENETKRSSIFTVMLSTSDNAMTYAFSQLKT